MHIVAKSKLTAKNQFILPAEVKEMNDEDKPPYRDPVIEAYRSGIDVTLILENLSRTPEERLRRLQDLQRFAEELRSAGKKLAVSNE